MAISLPLEEEDSLLDLGNMCFELCIVVFVWLVFLTLNNTIITITEPYASG